MLKNKKILLTMLILFLLFILPNIVNAVTTQQAEEKTKTSTQVEVEWSYELDGNNAKNLKCINISSITGSLKIPSTIDSHNVISIGNEAFKGCTGITEVTMPSSVKSIEYSAFQDCTNLSKVNLGSIESISFNVFRGCTSLKSIKIPKTLKNGSGSPSLNNSNITSITFEEGLTVIPSYLCANTGITEITIPNSVKEIGHYAFKDCKSLKKITILDNVTDMGFYKIEKEQDSVFTNHNNDLTIYCYKDSMAANYAIKYNIKYVYLTKPANSGSSDKQNELSNVGKDNNTGTKNDTTKKDTTIATTKLPNTGRVILAWIIGIVAVSAIVAHIRYKKLYIK